MANERVIKSVPGPGNEYVAGAAAPKSVPPVGLSNVSNQQNAVTGRFDVWRDGVRIAVCKTQSHANEISSHASVNWPNPNVAVSRNLVTVFEPPAGT